MIRKYPEQPIEIICDYCNKKFIKHICHLKKHNYCSNKCYGMSLVGKKQSEEMIAKRVAKISGELAPNWKGGNSRQYKRGYKSEQYKKWRKDVLKRDNYTCRKCGQHGGYLTSHHIAGFAKYPLLRYLVENGMTLCQKCHSETDNYRYKGKVG